MYITEAEVTPAIEEILKHISNEKEFEKFLINVSDQIINKGIAAKDIFKIKDTTLDKLYNTAYELFKYGQYNYAASIFYHLLLLNSKNPNYAYALGACFSEMKKYDSAILAFLQSYLYNSSNPQPIYDCAQCCLSLKHDEKAAEFLKSFIALTKDRTEWQSLYTRASLMLEKILNKKI